MGSQSSKPLVSKDEPYVIIPENRQDVEEQPDDEKQPEGEDLQELTGKVVLGIWYGRAISYFTNLYFG